MIYHGELWFIMDDFNDFKHHGQYFRKRNELYLSKKTGILPDIQKHGIGQYFWSELVQWPFQILYNAWILSNKFVKIKVSHMLHVWYIYLHLSAFVRANVGKYSSTMEHGFGKETISFPDGIIKNRICLFF